MQRFIPSLAVLVACGTATAGFGATIDTNTVIGPGSPLNGEAITVIDGVEGQTSVQIVGGGSVAGFDLKSSSVLTVNGGDVTYLSTLSGASALSLEGGTISCAESICRATDYDAIVTANDFSSVTLRGGNIVGPIRLKDASTLTVIGSDLKLSQFLGDWYISGTLADGTELGGLLTTLRIRGDGLLPERIRLVPESEAVFTVIVSCMFCLLYARRS